MTSAAKKPRGSLREAFELLAQLPERQYLQLTVEKDEERREGKTFLCACLMEAPPEGGWPSRGDYFGHPQGSDTYQQSAEPYTFDDTCHEGISADTVKDAAALTVAMLRRRLASASAVDAAKALR